ncbi:helix-turn-helix transcriptional regulator [Nocardiopsis lucentensis]|uniref:helix-turn-helix transcriptional regulator n=1 Tax=Nocardiopsis lucentensis TaxID=53441 RepID=UPI00036FDCA2|nr:LuxR C-terminal-related transcriptional regulator [Nocardiopsis lucentensis]
MLVSAAHSIPGTAPAERGEVPPASPAGQGCRVVRGRERELDDVRRVLRQVRASGLAVRIAVEGPVGAGRAAFAAECLKAARELGLRVQGPVRCPGSRRRSPLLPAGCSSCLAGGPWTRARPGSAGGAAHRTRETAGNCPASGRVWLRVGPDCAAVTRVHPGERVHRVRLGPLTRSAVVAMAEDVLRVPPGAPLTAFLMRANGHPALVRESLAGLCEEQALVRRKGVAEIRVDRLPARVYEWIDGVLGSLRFPLEKYLAVCASMGEEFASLEPTGKAMGAAEHEAEEMARVAVELGFLTVGDRVRFQSPMVHEVFWSCIPRRFPTFIHPAAPARHLPRPRAEVGTGFVLTAQEKRLIQLTSEGFTNRQIAHRLKISQHTVNYHLKKLFRKYEVNSRVRLVSTALKDTAPLPSTDGAP